VRREISFTNMKVGVAERAAVDSHPDVTWGSLRKGNVAKFERLRIDRTLLVEDGGKHKE
jgi:hypothetical protein